MTGSLMLIWDYDAAIGQVNASYPYKFDEEKIIQEIRNVDTILDLGEKYNVKMTFACLGAAAELGHYPYHVPEQIKKIHSYGHEIASHSWKHEWFPFLEREQIVRSLTRSKFILEDCIGEAKSVNGFVPPFSRPMSWYAKGALSLGDRVIGPWYPGADLGSLLKIVHEAGFGWCRATYRPVWEKIFRKTSKPAALVKRWASFAHVKIIPNHYVGFDEKACQLIQQLNQQGGHLVISGHPSGLTREKEESLKHLVPFLQLIDSFQNSGSLRTVTISNHLKER